MFNIENTKTKSILIDLSLDKAVEYLRNMGVNYECNDKKSDTKIYKNVEFEETYIVSYKKTDNLQNENFKILKEKVLFNRD